MIERALEVVERVESSELWFYYLVGLIVSGFIIVFMFYARQTQGEVVSRGDYLNLMGILSMPLGATILIRVLHALNYIIFGGESKE